MSAPRAAAQLLRMPVSLGYFLPPATARAGTAQRAIPTRSGPVLKSTALISDVSHNFLSVRTHSDLIETVTRMFNPRTRGRRGMIPLRGLTAFWLACLAGAPERIGAQPATSPTIEDHWKVATPEQVGIDSTPL